LLCIACVAYIFRPLAGYSAVEKHWGLAVTLMTALTVIALLLEAVLTALLRVDEQRARVRVALVDEMRVQLPLGAAVGASALLIAFAAEGMGLAALAVFTAPLLVTQVAVRRYAGTRATPWTATEQPHHQGGQRLRRPGGQLARPGPRRGRGAAASPGHGQRVRPGHRRGPQPRSKPPLRHPDVSPVPAAAAVRA